MALEAAFLTPHISRLVLYEPPLHEPVGNNLAVAARTEGMIAQGQLEQALVAFQTEIVRQSPEEIERMRAWPSWPSLVASIAVHPRQMRALSAWRFDANRMRALTIPTLLLIGETTQSPHARKSIDALEASLPMATRVVLPKQAHNAMEGGREVLAAALMTFASSAP